jgi:hypothetical protein
MRPVLVTALLVVLVAACQSSDVSRSIGARCDKSVECDDRCLEPSAEWPGGFCTLDCDVDEGCGDDGACIDESGGGVCAFTCSDDRQCAFLGTGYACSERDSHAGGTKVMVCRG